MHRVREQPAYVLHSRPYRNTSVLADFITPDYGRVSAVVRGVRSARSKLVVQPFSRLNIDWQGKSDLKTVVQVDHPGLPLRLIGKNLYSGLYLNELLMRLLYPFDPNAELFLLYVDSLQRLEANTQDEGDIDIEVVLRCFELGLIESLGYGVSLCVTGDTGDAICAELNYQYIENTGFIVDSNSMLGRGVVFSGGDLLGIQARNFSPQVKRTAKVLLRLILRQYLGDKPLQSRQLFR